MSQNRKKARQRLKRTWRQLYRNPEEDYSFRAVFHNRATPWVATAALACELARPLLGRFNGFKLERQLRDYQWPVPEIKALSYSEYLRRDEHQKRLTFNSRRERNGY